MIDQEPFEQLRAERDYDHAIIEELQMAVAGLLARKGRPPAVYANWQTWVDEWLARRVSGHPHRMRWCHRYAEHPEVADRLEALWLRGRRCGRSRPPA